jgi:hypothetical protein
MKRRTMVIATAASLLGLGGGWYWGSPWYTMWRMREAARSGDLAVLATYVDAPAITRGWVDNHREWRTLLAAKRFDPESEERLLAFSRHQLDKYDIKRGFSVGQVRAWLAALPMDLTGDKPRSCSLERHGLDRFDYRCGNDGAAGLSFRRKGLGWRADAVTFG